MVHRQENLNSLIGFSSCHVPFGDNCKRFWGWANTAGFHLGDKGPDSLVVAQSGGDVDGVIEGGGGVGVGGVVG